MVEDQVLVRDMKVSKLSALKNYYQKHKLRTTIIVVLILLAVILIGFFGFKYISDWRNKNNQRQAAYAALVKNVNQLRMDKKDEQAKLELLNFDKNHSDLTKEQRFWIANQLAAIYSTLKDYKTSVAWQEKAIENSSSVGFSQYMLLAEAYKNAGDNDKAIKNYKLALTALDSAGENVPKTAYKIQINYLIKKLESKSK